LTLPAETGADALVRRKRIQTGATSVDDELSLTL
jgi:hypothetical protein